jgi:hypothetical protein
MAAPVGLLAFGCLSLSAAPQIILKADDLGHLSATIEPRWQQFVDYIEANDMKAAIGIVTDSLESAGTDYYNWIRALHDSGTIEFWHHGYDHSRDPAQTPAWWEFKHTDYAWQKSHFEQGMDLAEEKLGIIFRTFGAPYNQTDLTTVQVLKENPNLRIWLYPQTTAGSTKLIMPRISAVNIEQATGVVVYAPFAANYPTYSGEDVLVLQCHPSQWDDNSWLEFIQIVDYLKADGATFTTPTAYHGIEDIGKAIYLDIDIDSKAGARYQVWRSIDLTTWERYGAQFFGTGERMTVQGPFYGTGSVFYRGEMLPADEPLFTDTFEALTAFNDLSPAAATAEAGIELVDSGTTPANLAGTGTGLRFFDYSVTAGVRALQDIALPSGFKLEVTFYNNNYDTLNTFQGPTLRFGNTGASLASSTNTAFYINFRKDDVVRAYYTGGAYDGVTVSASAAHVLTLYVNADTTNQLTYEGPSATRTLDPMSFDAYVDGVLIGTTANGMLFINPAGYTPADGIGRFGFNTSSTHVGADFTFDDLSISPLE